MSQGDSHDHHNSSFIAFCPCGVFVVKRISVSMNGQPVETGSMCPHCLTQTKAVWCASDWPRKNYRSSLNFCRMSLPSGKFNATHRNSEKTQPNDSLLN
jgi:hypothetical protein